MNVLMFLAVNTIVLLSSLFFTISLSIKRVRDNLLAFLTFVLSQIIGSMLLAGTLVGLTSKRVFAINIFLLVLSLLINKLSKQSTKEYFIRLKDEICKSMKELKWPPLLAIILFLVVFELSMSTLYSYLYPSYSYDSLMYHLVAIGQWIQDGKISMTPFVIWTNTYPFNTELSFGWILLFLKSDTWVDSVQIFYAIIGFFAVYGLAREFRLKREYSLSAAGIFVLTPILLVQTNTNYIDVAISSIFLLYVYFIAQYFFRRETKYAILAGLSGGIMLGMKYSAVSYVGIFILIIFIGMIIDLFKKNTTVWKIVKDIVAFTIPAALYGLFWYVRNWINYDNPIYPFNVSIGSKTIFHGLGTVKDLIMINNTPPEIRGIPWWQQVWASWTADPKMYTYDIGLGGFGVQWLYLLFPALLVFLVLSIWRERKRFMVIIAPIIVLFLITPSNYWTRYTIYIVSLGAIGLFYILDRMKQLKWTIQANLISKIVKLYLVALVSFSLIFTTSHSFFPASFILDSIHKPAKDRTIGTYFFNEFKWVDTVPAGSVIGMPKDHHPFIYPLMGKSVSNKVVVLDEKSPSLKEMQSQNLDYLFVYRGSSFDQWINKQLNYCEPYDNTMQKYVVYKVKK